MRTSDVAVPLLAAILAACGASENPSTTANTANSAAVDEVRARMQSYATEAKAGNAAALADFWTADALIMEAESQMTAAEEHKLAAEVLQTMDVTTFEVNPREHAAHDNGAVVYEFGSYDEVLTPKDGKTAPTTLKGNYAARWLKSAAGKWQIDRFISTPPPADSVKVGPPAPAVAPAAGADADAAAVSAQATQALNDFTAKINAGDAAGALPFVADDIQLYESEVQIMSKTDFAGLLNAVLGENTVNIALTTDQVFSHDGGSVAYLLAHFDETLTAKDGKTAPMSLRNNMLARWKRAAGGGWIMDRMIITPMPKAAAAAK